MGTLNLARGLTGVGLLLTVWSAQALDCQRAQARGDGAECRPPLTVEALVREVTGQSLSHAEFRARYPAPPDWEALRTLYERGRVALAQAAQNGVAATAEFGEAQQTGSGRDLFGMGTLPWLHEIRDDSENLLLDGKLCQRREDGPWTCEAGQQASIGVPEQVWEALVDGRIEPVSCAGKPCQRLWLKFGNAGGTGHVQPDPARNWTEWVLVLKSPDALPHVLEERRFEAGVQVRLYRQTFDYSTPVPRPALPDTGSE